MAPIKMKQLDSQALSFREKLAVGTDSPERARELVVLEDRQLSREDQLVRLVANERDNVEALQLARFEEAPHFPEPGPSVCTQSWPCTQQHQTAAVHQPSGTNSSVRTAPAPALAPAHHRQAAPAPAPAPTSSRQLSTSMKAATKTVGVSSGKIVAASPWKSVRA